MTYKKVIELQALIHEFMREDFVNEGWGKLARYGLGLDEIVKELPPRQKTVLEMRWGLVEGGRRTLEETGKALGVTRERIRQLEAKAFKNIEKSIREGKE